MTDVSPRSDRGPTLEEVAELAGVSRATVSRVVNGSPKVSDGARDAVELAIRTLGYIPNRAARSLVTRRSDSIALVVPEPETRFFSEPFFSRAVHGISQELATHDLQLVLLMPHGASDRDRLERYLLAGHVDGAVLISLHGGDPLPRRLQERGVPVVVGGRPPDGVEASFVDADNRGGAAEAVSYLLRAGRQRVATIAGSQDMSVGVDRLEGYREALHAAEVEYDRALVEPGDFSQLSGENATRALLARTPDLDALFVASDLMAVGALRALREAGRRVPDDVAIVGFDDSIVARSSQPQLSTVRQPVERMGREMAGMVVRAIGKEAPEPERLILATELILRASS